MAWLITFFLQASSARRNAVMIRHVILLLSLLCVDLNVVGGSVFSDILSIETVCDTDFITCPNGGRAFRDRNHDCDFTPCEFITAAAPTPTPIAIDPSTRNASWWFGNEEFYVPAIRFRELKRGKRIFKRMLRLIQQKFNDSRSWIQSGSFATSAYIYVTVPGQDASEQRSVGRVTNSRKSVDMLRTAATDANMSKEVLTVTNKPWSLYALFGCQELQSSGWTVLTALNLLHDTSNQLNWSDHQALNATGAPAAMLNSNSTLVLENDSDVIASSPAWVSQLSAKGHSKLCTFLEALLVRLGHARMPIDNQDNQLAQNDSRPLNCSIFVSAGSEHESEVSAAVFLTSMPELLQADEAVDTVVAWNFTRLFCDSNAFRRLQAQKDVLYRPVMGVTADTGSPDLKTNTTSSYVCSCWIYHHVRDETALAAQRLTYCR